MTIFDYCEFMWWFVSAWPCSHSFIFTTGRHDQRHLRYGKKLRTVSTGNFSSLHSKRFGFGESFISWTKTLFNTPSATDTTNRITSHSFTLHRGTGQRCPRSLLCSFHSFIEPSAAAVGQNLHTTGTQTSEAP